MKLKDLQASKNIAESLSDEKLKEIGADVCEAYDIDLSTRVQWEKKNKAANELALQITESKSSPWENAANVKFPLLTIAALQFQSRVYPALVKAPDLVKFRSQGSDPGGQKAARAYRVSSHMSYQMLEEDEHWEEQQDKAFFVLPISGCVFKKSYHDGTRDINCSEMVLPTELVLHYYAKSVEDAERKTHKMRVSERKIKEKILRGLYIEHDLTEARVEGPTEADRRQGLTPPAQDKDRPRLLLEQHAFLDLDGDGYKEPYAITVDYESKKVFRIIHRFKEVITEQSLAIQELQGRMLEIAQSIPQPQEGQQPSPEELSMIQAAESTLQQMQAQIQELSQQKPKVLRIEPIEYFTKYGLIPSPDGGVYDIGFGALLSPLNDSVNTLINQLIDSGTMQNSSSGFIGKGARIQGGKLKFSPNEWKQVNVAGSVLKDAIVPLPVNAPSSVLFQLLGLLINYTERVSSVTDLMSGENPGQNTPAYNMSAMLEQGMQVFNGIFKRVYRSFRGELRKMYHLNSLYLPEVEYFEYHDQGMQVFKTDYEGDAQDIIPAADPNAFAQKEKQAKAQMIAERAMMAPGYDMIKVEQTLLESMDIPNSAELFPVQQNPETGAMELVYPPQPDPEFELKRMEEERKALDSQNLSQTRTMETEGKLMLIEAQIMKINTEILKITADAEVSADSIEVKRMQMMLDDLKDKRRTLVEMAKIEQTDKQQGETSEAD